VIELGLRNDVYRRPLATALDRLGLREGWRCVDVGAGGGDVTIALDEANPIFEQALETVKGELALLLGQWFAGVQRVTVRAAQGGATPPARLTDEMVRTERLSALRRRDPVLGAAIDALDLDLAD